MKIGICIPSRGLIHSRTIERVVENLDKLKEVTNLNSWFYFSHDNSIPDSHNFLSAVALKGGADYIWMVEEDMLPPKTSTLNDLLFTLTKEGAGIVACDYPVGAKKYSTVCYVDGEPIWCGLGCTLISSDVLIKLDYPWFRNDYSFSIKKTNPLTLQKVLTQNKYGGYDVAFGIRVRNAGFKIAIISEVAGHLKIKEKGEKQQNEGVHQVEVWRTIENEQRYKGPLAII